jgi:hypothetical protein
MSAFGGKADMCWGRKWWDNFKNTLWDSMGRLIKVGHGK